MKFYGLLFDTEICKTNVIRQRVIVVAISAIFQQYHGGNKLIFNEMMRSALF
jgi:hypothetical protein